MIRLIYRSVQKATKDLEGVTQVTIDIDGTLVELGTVTVKKGAKNFKAILLDGTNLDGKFTTKKQAGGALQKNYNDSDKVVAPHPVTAAPVEEPKVVEPKPEPKPEPVVETVKPVTETEMANAAAESITSSDESNSAGLLDNDFDGGDSEFPVMPIFLRRDLWTDKDWERYSN